MIQLQQICNYFQSWLRPPCHLPPDFRGEEYKGYLIELRSPCMELKPSYITACIHAPSGKITSAFTNGESSLVKLNPRNPQATVDFCITQAKRVIDDVLLTAQEGQNASEQ